MTIKSFYNHTLNTQSNRYFTSQFFEGIGIGSHYMRKPFQAATGLIPEVFGKSKIGKLMGKELLNLLLDNPIAASILSVIETGDVAFKTIEELANEVADYIADVDDEDRLDAQLRGVQMNLRFDHAVQWIHHVDKTEGSGLILPGQKTGIIPNRGDQQIRPRHSLPDREDHGGVAEGTAGSVPIDTGFARPGEQGLPPLRPVDPYVPPTPENPGGSGPIPGIPTGPNAPRPPPPSARPPQTPAPAYPHPTLPGTSQPGLDHTPFHHGSKPHHFSPFSASSALTPGKHNSNTVINAIGRSLF